MKKILITILLVSLLSGLKAQFANTQTIGSKSTLFKSLGGMAADSALILLNSFPDTAAANLSVVSKYNGSFIRIGTSIYYRTLLPNKWNALTSGGSGVYLPISDTASMLTPFVQYSDTASMLSSRLKISDTATMLAARPLNNRFTDSIATLRALAQSKGIGTLISVATNSGTGIAGGTITSSGTLRLDTVNLSTRLWRQKGTDSVSNLVNVLDLAKLNKSDTATMLLPYLRKSDTMTLSNRINLKVNISDTATMLSPYAKTSNLPSLTPYKLISDTLFNNGYTTRVRTKQQTDSLGGEIGTKLNASTAASTYVPYTGATTNLNLGANHLYGSETWENSATIYSSTRIKTAGNFQNDLDSTGLFNESNGYKFYAVGAGLNSWYTPQSIISDKFVKIGGTSAQYLMADGSVTGSGGTISSGTYFPTLTNTTNISSSVLTNATYTRVDSIVTVYVTLGCTPTSTSNSVIRIELPFSTSSSTASGMGVYDDGTYKMSILNSFSTTYVSFIFSGTASTAGVLRINFQYKVL